MTREWIDSADRLSFYREKSGVQIYKGYEAIYERLRGRSMAIRDDYCFWALHGEQSRYGKVFVMDSADREQQHLFFDDCASYILDARDVKDTEASLEFADIKGIHAVHVNSFAVMQNDNYFVDKLITAERLFDQIEH